MLKIDHQKNSRELLRIWCSFEKKIKMILENLCLKNLLNKFF